MILRNVCVIGAGTMGGGIAAHLANLGFQVTLLDQTEEAVRRGAERLRTAKPPHFFLPERLHDVRLGTVAESGEWIGEAEWVIEAIIERPEAKKALYESLLPHLGDDAIITTNTSGLEIGLLADGLPESFRRRFLGAHFFNPPRYLKLLELIPTSETDPEITRKISQVCEADAGKRVVLAKDTPGFIANRYGMWCMYLAVHIAEKLQLTVEQADAITGPFLGRPKSGSFRLNDLVGLDVMDDIATNLMARCTEDPHVAVLARPKSLNFLLAKGALGEKVGQGYYRREGKELLAFDLVTHAYRQRQDVDLPGLNALAKRPLAERVRLALGQRDEVGEFLRLYLAPALRYAELLKEEISHSVQDFDRVMRWGFGWEMGPFEMIDAIGSASIGLSSPSHYIGGQYREFSGELVTPAADPQFLTLLDYPVIEQHENFRIRDLGDGVRAISIGTKMGTVTPDLVDELSRWLRLAAAGPLVLASEARAYSVGFDLKFFSDAIDLEDWDGIDRALAGLQTLGELLEARPTVAAVHGYVFGGGLEVAMSCTQVVADAEAQIGMPEAKVGLFPGGRGTTLMRLNNPQTAKRLAEVVGQLAQGITSTNAEHARTLGILRPGDIVSYHPDRLIYRAKQAALHLKGAEPRPAWTKIEGPVLGQVDAEIKALQTKGLLSGYDLSIAEKIRNILVKSDSYEAALARERSEFIDLCHRPHTVARIRHMLEQKTALKN